jgi:hypothetical protein
LDELAREEAWRFAERERNFHSATRCHLALQLLVFLAGESRVEVLPVGRNHPDFWGTAEFKCAPEGAILPVLTASLKRCPDTNLYT